MQRLFATLLARIRAFFVGRQPMSNFEACLQFTLRAEGGFSDNPADPAGATNMGITEATLARWRGEPVNANDVRDLTEAEAAAIYRCDYWNRVQGDALPAGVDLAVFDMGVNAGVRESAKLLQAAVGTVQDGAIGPVTLAAVRAQKPFLLIGDLCDRQAAFYRSLPAFPTFGRGWLARTEARRAAAMALMAQG